MHFEFLTEEPSAARLLEQLVPRILDRDVSFDVHPFRGKGDLLSRLPARLRAYRRFMPPDWRIVLMVDADDDDCRKLKQRLESAASDAGFVTVSAAGPHDRAEVLIRVVVSELESWLLGDPSAVAEAYPAAESALKEAGVSDPDQVRDAWELLERILRSGGYFRSGLPKVAVAREVSSHMDPDRNRSHSFAAFRDGVRRLAGRR